jgi:hypothetical protein
VVALDRVANDVSKIPLAGMSTFMEQMELVSPDLALSLALDPYAPRAARYHIAQVDRPSPDLRDAVVLLTSELVTRAVQLCETGEAAIELRAWMPHDVVRVELHAPAELLEASPTRGGERDYSLMLLDQLADRWSLEPYDELACMWFEIDRHGPGGGQSGMTVGSGA